jgi:quinoprotein dehydrogenase-associated probable ABC transporter substrate-binding protein
MRTILLTATLLCLAAGAGAQQPELLTMVTELKICADPHDLPFSNQAGEGFENKIAAVIAADLKLPLTYVWFPQVFGFVRNTLGARQCDLVMGTVTGDESMDTTDPYYHTGYMLVTRAADQIAAHSLADPALAAKRFGVIAATPPTDLLLKQGLLGQTHSYALAVDTRSDNPARAMMDDLVAGRIDVALIWGPIAGYAIAHDKLPLHAVFLQPEAGAPRLDYQIAMGVRPGEPEWRRRINAAVSRHRDEITAILSAAGIPLLDAQNRPIPPAE